jgi:hypothetical protein
MQGGMAKNLSPPAYRNLTAEKAANYTGDWNFAYFNTAQGV